VESRRNRGHFPAPNRAGEAISYNVLRCRPVINHNSPQVQHDHLQVLLEIDSRARLFLGSLASRRQSFRASLRRR
jgi:hypothetical protein